VLGLDQDAFLFYILLYPIKTIHTGVINGAMLLMKRAFDLTPFQQEVVVSSTVLSAFGSSLVGGNLNNAWGRRKCILFCASVFTVGSLFLMIAWDYYSLVLGRIIVGIAIGIASLTTPVYIAGAYHMNVTRHRPTVSSLT
jgi:MFS family permease